jgi:hypothetical protein
VDSYYRVPDVPLVRKAMHVQRRLCILGCKALWLGKFKETLQMVQVGREMWEAWKEDPCFRVDVRMDFSALEVHEVDITSRSSKSSSDSCVDGEAPKPRCEDVYMRAFKVKETALWLKEFTEGQERSVRAQGQYEVSVT